MTTTGRETIGDFSVGGFAAMTPATLAAMLPRLRAPAKQGAPRKRARAPAPSLGAHCSKLPDSSEAISTPSRAWRRVRTPHDSGHRTASYAAARGTLVGLAREA